MWFKPVVCWIFNIYLYIYILVSREISLTAVPLQVAISHAHEALFAVAFFVWLPLFDGTQGP